MSCLHKALCSHIKAAVLHESIVSLTCIIWHHHQNLIICLVDRHTADFLIFPLLLWVHGTAWDLFINLYLTIFVITKLENRLEVHISRNLFFQNLLKSLDLRLILVSNHPQSLSCFTSFATDTNVSRNTEFCFSADPVVRMTPIHVTTSRRNIMLHPFRHIAGSEG